MSEMDASFNKDQIDSNRNNTLINDDIHYQISKKWKMQNFIFCPFSIDLWDIYDLTLKIDKTIEDNKLRYSAQTLSRLSQLKKLTILISHKYPESIFNSVLVGLSWLVNLSDLTIEFSSKQISNNEDEWYYGQNHFFEGISKLIGLKKLSCSFSKQSKENVNKLLDSIASLPNLICLQLDLEVMFFSQYEKFNYLFKLKQLQQFNLFLRVWIPSVFYITNGLGELELLTHLSLIYYQGSLDYSDVSILAQVISTLRNLEYLELKIRISEFFSTNNMLNPFISAGSFVKLSKLKNLTINIKDKQNKSIKIQQWIYEAISQLKNLPKLTLKINGSSFQKKKLSPILGQSLSNLSQLTELQVNINNMEIPNNKCLLKGISKLTQLSTLSLNFVPSHDCIVKDFFNLSVCIAKLVNLEKLSLQLKNQNITGSQITVLTTAIDNLSKLSCLQLGLTGLQFGEESMVPFASGTFKLTGNLRELHLNLDCCMISKKEAECFSIGISKLTNLITLGITGSNNDVDLVKSVLSEASKLASLRILITNNEISTPQIQQFLKKSSHLVDFRRC